MQIKVCHQLSELDALQWNALTDGDNPFVRYEFLQALEQHDCLGPKHGWLPHHLVCFDDTGVQLLAALPLYLKDNSYGEFVFDWGWADAYQRNGLEYYPKLVSCIPYTPAQGPRLLIHDDVKEPDTMAHSLLAAAIQLAQQQDCSSLHILFTEEEDTRHLREHGLLMRMGVQFHWHNRAYKDFDDYLSHFSSKKRKNIRQERRKVAESGIEIECLHGDDINEGQWQRIYHFYQVTFHKKSGYPSLSLAFFQAIAKQMPESLVVFMARHEGRYVAASICFRGDTGLYGRHWGCDEAFDSLHFELCYYQGLEYAIKHGLQLFEPGAQGEHKISRGFEPTRTWSGHWIAHPQFSQAIENHLQHETGGMEQYHQELTTHLPFKNIDGETADG